MPKSQMLERHYNLIRELPEVGSFTHADVVATNDDLTNLSKMGLIENIDDPHGEPSTYRLTPTTRDWLADYEPEWVLPCGHRGLRNPAGVDGYRCQFEHCDAVFTRPQVEAAMAEQPIAADGGETQS